MMKLQLSYFGHTVKREKSLEKEIMFGEIEGTWRSGRLATKWLNTLTTAGGMTLEDLTRLAQNRLLFRFLVHQVARTWTQVDGT